MVGGLANCPDCGKATEVEGLRDPLWRLWTLIWLAGISVAATVAFAFGGSVPALLVLIVGGLLMWAATVCL